MRGAKCKTEIMILSLFLNDLGKRVTMFMKILLLQTIFLNNFIVYLPSFQLNNDLAEI